MTALKTAEIDRFVARPDPAQPIVLVYGPGVGLVRERVDALVKASVDDVSDPFAFVRIEGDELSGNPARPAAAARAAPFWCAPARATSPAPATWSSPRRRANAASSSRPAT